MINNNVCFLTGAVECVFNEDIGAYIHQNINKYIDKAFLFAINPKTLKLEINRDLIGVLTGGRFDMIINKYEGLRVYDIKPLMKKNKLELIKRYYEKFLNNKIKLKNDDKYIEHIKELLETEKGRNFVLNILYC